MRVTSAVPPWNRARVTLVRQANDTLVFSHYSAFSPGKQETAITLANISRLELPDIPMRDNRKRAAAVGKGVLIGGLAGGALGFAARTCNDNCGYFGPGFNRAVHTAFGVLAGGLVGGIVGGVAGRHSSEKWRTVHPRP